MRLRSLAASIVEHGVFYGLLLILAFIMIVWNLLSLPLLLLPYSMRPSRAGSFMATLGSRLFLKAMAASGMVRFDLGELDALCRDGALIIAPNHPTMLDALLCISRLPRLVCVGKARLWDNPLLGAGMRLAGYIRNDSPVNLVKLAIDKLRQGQHQLLMFPEGTRTSTAPLGPLRGGFAVIARHAGIPIQTVLIETNSPYLGKDWPLFKKPDFPIFYRVRLGRRFVVESNARTFVPLFEAYLVDELSGAVQPQDVRS